MVKLLMEIFGDSPKGKPPNNMKLIGEFFDRYKSKAREYEQIDPVEIKKDAEDELAKCFKACFKEAETKPVKKPRKKKNKKP